MGWQQKNSTTAVIFSMAILAVHVLIFPQYMMSVPVLIMGLFVILFFYFALNAYTRKWTYTRNFSNKLFAHSLLYRSLAVLGMYILTYYYDPESLPLEIGAADAWNYHMSGELVASTLHKGGNIFNALSTFWKNENDYGFSVYIGLIYYIFGPYVIVIKLLNGLIGSFMVVRLYQSVRMIYEERAARLSGILAMIFPSLLWFSAMTLKETLMMYFLVNICFYVLKITTEPQKGFRYSALLILFLIPLYFFRVFLLPLVLFCVLLHFVFYRSKREQNKLLLFIASACIVAGSFVVVKTFNMQESFGAMIDASSNTFNNELSNSAMQRGISYKQALVAPFIFVGAVITPFPSLLHINDKQVGIYIHYQNELVRNAMYFFVFVSVYMLFKKRNRRATYPVSFAVGYILILAISGVSFQDRFQVLALPFLIMLMGNGIMTEYSKKNSQWRFYLFMIAVAIISWNLFKLSVRELI